MIGYDAPVEAGSRRRSGRRRVLLPGLVDTHVHVNEPGRTEWEGFATATRAAAAGGVTTIVDMPLNSLPPTVDPAALAVKRQAAARAVRRRRRLLGRRGARQRRRAARLHDAGVFGFKCFLVDSGVAEFPPLGPDGLARRRGAGGARRRCCSCTPRTRRARSPPRRRRRRTRDFLASRPPARRGRGDRAGCAASRAATGARVHILHLSGAGAAAALAAAKADGVPSHRRDLPALPDARRPRRCPDGATEFKCCPPIRERRQPRRAVGRRSPTAPSTASSPTTRPAPPELKRSTPATSPPPGAGSRRCSSACRWCGPRPARAAHASPTWCAGWRRRPADLAGLAAQGPHRARRRRRPGRLRPGRRVRRGPGARCTTGTRSRRTPGRGCTGVVRGTWLRGAGRRATTGAAEPGRLLASGGVIAQDSTTT